MSKIIVFGASWCGPCKILKSKLASFLSDAGLEITVEHADVDDEDDQRVEEHGITNVPTSFFVKDERIVERFVGITNYPSFLQRCKAHLALDNAFA